MELIISIIILPIILTGYVLINKRFLSQMVGMTIAMGMGMSVGLLTGLLAGMLTPDLLIIATIRGILLGLVFGCITGVPFGISGFLDGLLSGTMGGMMGAMLGTMVPLSEGYPMFEIMVVIFITVMILIFYKVGASSRRKSVFFHNILILAIAFGLFYFFTITNIPYRMLCQTIQNSTQLMTDSATMSSPQIKSC